MLQKRVIPCLLLHKRGLFKTIQFKNPSYIGDPINAIKIFNEKEVDELIIIDIDATVSNREPNYKFIEDIASECFMPVCYGGGVKTIAQMKKIYSLGIEKISLSSVVIENPSILKEAQMIFGSQSVIVTIDVKKDLFGRKKIFINNGKINTRKDPISFAKEVVELGAGEIVINSIDNDGCMKGYDFEFLKEIKKSINIPLIALGGAGNLNHIKEVFEISNVDAVACGSLFVYHGALKGILLNYPPYQRIQKLLED